MNLSGFETHDHAHCIAGAVGAAEARCRAKGLQFTPVRRRVLELLLREHRAMGAYEVLEHLAAEALGSQPPVAYRALDFLVTYGFAHRIERLNAFVACAEPGVRHAPAFMICRHCGRVAEAQAEPVRGALARAARRAGFTIERTVVEAEGLCPDCVESPAA